MSHNYPYRRPQPDSSLRSDPGHYSSSDRRHASPDHDFYQAPQESYSSSYPSSSSSRVTQWTQDGAVRILNSCGLDTSDLALLAEMPEDSLTVESLPQVLHQIKGKRGTVKQYPPPPSPSSSSYPSSSTRRPHVSPPTSDWDRPHSQPLQYQMDPVKPSPPPELDRWGNPITFSSVRAQQALTALAPSTSLSSSSSSYTVDLQHRRAPPDYGKTSRDAKPVSFQDYNHKSGTPELIKPGRDSRQFSSQDYHHRSPGSNTSLASSQNYNHRPGPLDFGKTGRDTGPAFSQDRPSFSSASRDKTTHPSRYSQPGPADYKPPPLLPVSRPKPLWGGSSGPETSSSKTTSSSQPGPSMPSKENALDFHGTTPPTYPYSCSLCAITVMSEKVWLKHINGPHHADGQLSLLQRFPNWDCRLETVGRADNQSERWRDDRKPMEKPQTAIQSSRSSQQNRKPSKKATEKSKVVCVKFLAHSVDESYLRKLAEPFGRIIKILMFPSLAFVELGSMDQARDMVKFHENYPLTVNGEQMEFRLSNTFNFLQSSRVVTFIPPPSGEDGRSDLISIIKRFGSPLYTLFLPSKVFVEMKDASEAQKLVDYYSTNRLRINQDLIQVSFSGEYNSLMRIPSAKKYEEETERMKSSSKEIESRSSRDRDEGRNRSRERSTRSKSRDKSSRDGGTRIRSRSKEMTKEKKSESKEKASHERKSESREESSRERRSESREESSRERRSESREESSRERRSESGKKSVKEEETEMPVFTDASSGPDPVTELKHEAAETQQTDQEEPSEDDSDIEGMEVIGEDEEDLQDEEMEALVGSDGEEEEEEEEPAEKEECPPERTDSPDADKNVELKEGEENEEVNEETDHERQQEEKEEEEKPLKEEEEGSEPTRETETQQEENESEPDFPVDLDSCITLDELGDDDCDYQDEEVRADHQSPSSRVLYFSNVPLGSFTDSEFIRLVKGYGKAVRFFRIPGREGGFIEMSSSSEAQRAIEGLTAKPLRVNGCNIHVQISSNYYKLTKGWMVEDVDIEEEEEKNESSRNQGSRRSQRLSKKPSDKDETSRKLSSKKTLERDGTSRRSEEKESRTSKRKASEKQPASRKSAEKTSEKKSPEKEKTTRTTRGSEKKSKEKDSASTKSAEDERKEVESTTETDKNKSDKKSSPEEDKAEKKVQEKDSKGQNKSTSKTSEEESRTSKRCLEKESESSRSAEKYSEKTSPEKKSRTSPESESTNNKTKENKSKTKQNKSKMEEIEPKTKDDSKIEENGSDKSSKKTLEMESKSKQEKPSDSDSKQTPGKDSVQETSQTKAIKRKGSQKNNSVPDKKEKKNESLGESAEVPREEQSQVQDSPESALKDPGSPHPPDSTGERDQKPADQLMDSNVPIKEQSEPAGGATELQKPTKPVGTEFVRPVVGYFCNLCQLIYADEDEAKQKHCSSLEHYRKYQEKTGKDPWAS
ncbi:zinc finger protein 638-like isoform X2 [Cheilinus undulatus]|nr:zinc finger protein 638-like isoform X2 [Cheilinus undulatus]